VSSQIPVFCAIPVPPVLQLGDPQVIGLTVTVNGVALPGYQGATITRISWDWGDSYKEDHWFPASHTYRNAATYSIAVTAYQNDGRSTTSYTVARLYVTQVTEITQRRPPSLTLYGPEINGLTVRVNGVATPGYQGATVTRIYWDWGDGSSENAWFPASHTYPSGGTYSITATCYQSDGLSATSYTVARLYITPRGQPPRLTLGTPQISGLTVTINGVATPGTPGATIARIFWDWGDGSSGNQWFPASHTYPRAGTYKIIVTAYQSDGLPTSTSTSAVVGGAPEVSVRMAPPFLDGWHANGYRQSGVAISDLGRVFKHYSFVNAGEGRGNAVGGLVIGIGGLAAGSAYMCYVFSDKWTSSSAGLQSISFRYNIMDGYSELRRYEFSSVPGLPAVSVAKAEVWIHICVFDSNTGNAVAERKIPIVSMTSPSGTALNTLLERAHLEIASSFGEAAEEISWQAAKGPLRKIAPSLLAQFKPIINSLSLATSLSELFNPEILEITGESVATLQANLNSGTEYYWTFAVHVLAQAGIGIIGAVAGSIVRMNLRLTSVEVRGASQQYYQQYEQYGLSTRRIVNVATSSVSPSIDVSGTSFPAYTTIGDSYAFVLLGIVVAAGSFAAYLKWLRKRSANSVKAIPVKGMRNSSQRSRRISLPKNNLEHKFSAGRSAAQHVLTPSRVLAFSLIALVVCTAGLGLFRFINQPIGSQPISMPPTLFTITATASRSSIGTQIMTENFRYDTANKLKEAGWTVANEDLLLLDGQSVTLVNDGARYASIRYMFSTPVTSNWVLEAKMLAIASSLHSSFMLRFLEKPNGYIYVFRCDDFDRRFYLARWVEASGVHSSGYRTGGWDGYLAPPEETWVTLKIERRVDALHLYFNGKLIGRFADEISPQLAGIELCPGAMSILKYDWVKVEALPS